MKQAFAITCVVRSFMEVKGVRDERGIYSFGAGVCFTRATKLYSEGDTN